MGGIYIVKVIQYSMKPLSTYFYYEIHASTASTQFSSKDWASLQ